MVNERMHMQEFADIDFSDFGRVSVQASFSVNGTSNPFLCFIEDYL
jgi:hypothetical protein